MTGNWATSHTAALRDVIRQKETGTSYNGMEWKMELPFPIPDFPFSPCRVKESYPVRFQTICYTVVEKVTLTTYHSEEETRLYYDYDVIL